MAKLLAAGGTRALHIADEDGGEDVGAGQCAVQGVSALPCMQRCCRPGCAPLSLLLTAAVARPHAAADTPLHMAAMKGDADIVRLLVAAGADCRRANRRGLTPRDIAEAKGDAGAAAALRG